MNNISNAQINLTDDLGGTEHISMSLTRQFIAKGIRSRFVVPLTDKSPVIEKWGSSFGVNVDISSYVPSNNERSLGQMLRFSNYIRSLGCPIVNLHYGQNHVPLKDVLAARIAGARKIFLTPHNAMPWEMLGDRRKDMTRRSALSASKIIAITDQTYELYLEAGIPKERIITIHCGFRDVPEFNKATIRKKYNISDNAFVIMYAGRLAAHKGVSVLIKACSLLKEIIPDLFLLIVGDGADRKILEDEGNRLLQNKVLFTGRVTQNMVEVYAVADIFAMASEFEGLPAVYIEAAMQHVPSIGTDVGGTRTFLKHNETGLIIHPGDINALTDSIYRLYSDPLYRRKIGDAAWAYAKQNFVESMMFEKYLELYKQ